MRLAKIDSLRGLNLISMICYHAMWDIVFLFYGGFPWYSGWPGFYWQQSICWIFILLSGFSWPLGHRHFKRGLTVFLCGALITLVTALFMPAEVVWFGILTFMGSAMLLMIPLDRLIRPKNRIRAVILGIISFLLFLALRNINNGRILGFTLPSALYADHATAYLGFPPGGFFSTDYFPLLPWFFLYICGYALHFLLPLDDSDHPVTQFLTKSCCPPLEFIGRHTLIIYMLHQPVIFGILSLINA